MALHFSLRKKTNKLKPEGKQDKYYAVPVSSSIVGTKKLAEIISDRCSATDSDVSMVLSSLAYVMGQQLMVGNKVKLDGLGIFSVSVSSPGFDTPNECTLSQVKAKRICFLADKTLKRILKKVDFRRKD